MSDYVSKQLSQKTRQFCMMQPSSQSQSLLRHCGNIVGVEILVFPVPQPMSMWPRTQHKVIRPTDHREIFHLWGLDMIHNSQCTYANCLLFTSTSCKLQHYRAVLSTATTNIDYFEFYPISKTFCRMNTEFHCSLPSSTFRYSN